MSEEPGIITPAQYADEAYEALRAMNHLHAEYPAPVAYEVLGNLKNVGYALAGSCEKMLHGLQRSLETYEVYDDEGKDPAASVAEAKEHLTQGAHLATMLGDALSAAQAAINSQGYHRKK